MTKTNTYMYQIRGISGIDSNLSPAEFLQKYDGEEIEHVEITLTSGKTLLFEYATFEGKFVEMTNYATGEGIPLDETRAKINELEPIK